MVKSTKKKAAKKAPAKKAVKVNTAAEKAKTIVIVAIFLGLLLTLAVLGIVLVNEAQKRSAVNNAVNKPIIIEDEEDPENGEGFEYEGWIDCMPPLDDEEAELCRKAEEAGYDKIAY